MSRAAFAILLALAVIMGAAEAATTESPTSAAPGTDASTTAASGSDASTTVTSGADASTTASSGTDAATTAAPGTDAATTAAPGTDAASTAAPGTDAATTAPTATNSATTAAPGADASTTAAPGTDAATAAAPGADASTTAAPGTDAATKAAPGTDAATTAAPGTDAATDRGDVSTKLKEAVKAGESVLEVMSTSGFLLGDEIVIDMGLSVEETHTIKAISSITTNSSMKNNHSSNASVQLKPKATTTTTTIEAPVTAAPVTAAPVNANPCAPVVAAAPSDPCAVASVGYARLVDGEGKAGKTSQAGPLTLVNAGMFGLAALCIAGVAVGVRSIKKRSTRTFQPLAPSADPESGSLELLSEEQPLE